jgi:hypothetical protein
MCVLPLQTRQHVALLRQSYQGGYDGLDITLDVQRKCMQHVGAGNYWKAGTVVVALKYIS